MIRVSPWTPIAAMWLIMSIAAIGTGEYVTAWGCLACAGMSVLSSIVERLQRRELGLSISRGRIMAARIARYEKRPP